MVLLLNKNHASKIRIMLLLSVNSETCFVVFNFITSLATTVNVTLATFLRFPTKPLIVCKGYCSSEVILKVDVHSTARTMLSLWYKTNSREEKYLRPH